MRLLAYIFASVTVVSSVFAMSAKPLAKPVRKSDLVTIFLTGNELGELQPCGCSGGQLGGLDRRAAIFNTVDSSKKMIVDTGSIVERPTEQNLYKFDITFQAFELLGYDVVSFSEIDVEVAQNLGIFNNLSSDFKVITAYKKEGVKLPAKFSKKFPLKEKPLIVTVAAFDIESQPLEKIDKIFKSRSAARNFNMLILNNCEKDVTDYIVEKDNIDCIICPAESDEPVAISDPNERPLIISLGRYGKYVGKLAITAKPKSDKLSFNFSAIPVTENLLQQPALVELYKTYQQIVKQANLIEKQPRYSLPSELKYTGSQSCKTCHKYEYNKWSTKVHARAYATLEKVNSHFDPECVICHVVGLEYESGFVSEQKTPEMKNVGCENCHGPGSEHIESAGAKPTAEPKSFCEDCHTPEKSAEYAGNEQKYFEKIIHWVEPNSVDNVKSKGGSENKNDKGG